MDATPHPSLMITNKWVTQKQNGLPTFVMRLNKKSLFLHIIACNTSVAFSVFFAIIPARLMRKHVKIR